MQNRGSWWVPPGLAPFGWLLSGQMRNGGCQFHAFPEAACQRRRGRTWNTLVTALIKFTKRPCPSTVVFLLRWKSQTHTSLHSQRFSPCRSNNNIHFSVWSQILPIAEVDSYGKFLVFRVDERAWEMQFTGSWTLLINSPLINSWTISIFHPNTRPLSLQTGLKLQCIRGGEKHA